MSLNTDFACRKPAKKVAKVTMGPWGYCNCHKYEDWSYVPLIQHCCKLEHSLNKWSLNENRLYIFLTIHLKQISGSIDEKNVGNLKNYVA